MNDSYKPNGPAKKKPTPTPEERAAALKKKSQEWAAKQQQQKEKQKANAEKQKKKKEAGLAKQKQERAQREQDKKIRFVYDAHPEPLPGYKFKVYIMGLRLGFTKITNLEEEAATIPLQEGGVNDRVHNLVAPVTTEHTLILERGVILNTLTGMLINPLAIGSSIPGDILITLLNRNGTVGRCFLIKHAYVKKISFDGIDSMNSNPVIQRFELAYEKMETINTLGVIPPIPDFV